MNADPTRVTLSFNGRYILSCSSCEYKAAVGAEDAPRHLRSDRNEAINWMYHEALTEFILHCQSHGLEPYQ